MGSYPFPWDLWLEVARSLPGGERSLTHDAARMVSRIVPPPVVEGVEHIPSRGPVVLAANHYQRRGLWIGWPGAVITTAVAGRRHQDPPVRWLVTGGLQVLQARGRGPVVPMSGTLLRAVSRLYGMAALPLTGRRARARVLRSWIRAVECGSALGVFPEGLSGRSDGLRPPDEGFVSLCFVLAKRGVPFLPVGVFEAGGGLHVRFGPPAVACLTVPRGEAAGEVMRAIAMLLPRELRGPYGALE